MRAPGRSPIDPVKRRAPSKRQAMLTLAIVIAVFGFVLRVYAPGPTTETYDEPSWLQRADAFRTALVTHDFAQATAAHHARAVSRDDTMPGVTTMWAGTIGRAVAVTTGQLGLTAKVVGPSDQNSNVLRVGRAVVALWCSIALGLFIYLAWRLFGRATAFVAGILLATEPMLIGQSDLLHTDAMVTMFSAVSMLALAVGLGLATRGNARRSVRGRHARRKLAGFAKHLLPGWVIASGMFAGLAALTKLNAVAILVPGPAIIACVAWRQRRDSLRLFLRVIVGWLAATLATFAVLWPAMWVAPLEQLTDMRHSLRQVGDGHLQFFFGHVSNDPGKAFYFVIFLLKATPWLVAGTLVAIGLAVAELVHRLHPRHPLDGLLQHLDRVPLWPLAICVPYFAAISWSPQKADRYLLPVVPFVAVVVGAIVSATVLARAPWPQWHNPIAVAAVVGAICLAINAGAQAPYAAAYVDPLVGGPRVARHAILLGGVGFERFGATIARERAGNCGQTLVATAVSVRIALPCGEFVSTSQFERADYVITSLDQLQRRSPASNRRLLSALHQRATVVQAVTIGGVTYAELWRARKVGPNLKPVVN